MTASAKLAATEAPAPRPAAEITSLPQRREPALKVWAEAGGRLAASVLPPLVTILIVLGLWELLGRGQQGGLPTPSAIWTDSKDLILHPFFDHGGVDKGLFWHVATSLSRVGVGFGLSAVVGVALGVLVGASIWAHRGLDPIFQVLRTVPPLAWLPLSLAAFHQAQPAALFVIFITSI